MSAAAQRLGAELNKRLTQRQQASWRQRLCKQQSEGCITTVAGESLLSFSDFDYLGLAKDPRVIEALHRAAKAHGISSGGSALISGYHSAQYQLEQALSEFFCRSKTLLFSSGYMANLAVVTALMGKNDGIVADHDCHASIIDACQLSPALFTRFRHNNPEHLTSRMQQLSSVQHKLIITEGVFSMTGHVAPLSVLSEVCESEGGWLMVDDAHGFGVLGPEGQGIVAQQNLNQEQVPILMTTFGKSLGTIGACISGPDELIEYLVQYARPYIYTTALSPAIATASLKSLEILKQEQWRREQLHQRIIYFKTGAAQRGIKISDSDTHIQTLVVGSPENALHLSGKLRERSILCPAIRPPTVTSPMSCLRVALTVHHQPQHIDKLLDSIYELN